MQEKRSSQTFPREYTITYSVKQDAHKTFNMYKLLDISKGGLKFFSYDRFEMGTRMVFFIKFPFLYPHVITVEGDVVAIQDVLKGTTYKIGIHFIDVLSETQIALEKMEQLNIKKP